MGDFSELRGRYRRQLTAAMAPRSYTKTYKVPRRPFESARLDSELKLVGEFGLRNKREVWHVQLTLSKIRRAARQLLTLDEKDPKRLFEGNALIRRLVRVGVLDESRMKLDYVLALKVEDFLERRLQTCVYKLGLAKSIHHARVLIRQRHIRVGKQIVNVPSLSVWTARSTSTSPSPRHLVVAARAVSGERRPRLLRRRMRVVTRARRRRSRSFAYRPLNETRTKAECDTIYSGLLHLNALQLFTAPGAGFSTDSSAMSLISPLSRSVLAFL